MSTNPLRARLLIPVFVCALWLVPSSASAQCNFEAAVFADLWDSGVDAIEVYGAGWDGSSCNPPVCGHTYVLHATLWFNSVVVNSQTFDEATGAVSYYTVNPTWVSWDVAFVINCSCAGFLPVGSAGGALQVVRPSCTHPPLLGRDRGLSPGGFYTYRIYDGFDYNASQGIHAAFLRWKETNAVAGNLFWDPESENPNIRLQRAPPFELGGAYAGVGPVILDGYSTVLIAYIKYSDFTGHAVGYNGLLKLTLHEVGHVHGVGDLYEGENRSSVMLQAGGPSDGGDNIAPAPTICDVMAAQQAFTG